jgi:hypothetical protein
MASNLQMTLEPVGQNVAVVVRNLNPGGTYQDFVTVYVYAVASSNVPVPAGIGACWKGAKKIKLGPYEGPDRPGVQLPGLDKVTIVCTRVTTANCNCWSDTGPRWLVAKLVDSTWPPANWQRSSTTYPRFIDCAVQSATFAMTSRTEPDGVASSEHQAFAFPSAPNEAPQKVQFVASFVPARDDDPVFTALLQDQQLVAAMLGRNLKFASNHPPQIVLHKGVESYSHHFDPFDPDDDGSVDCECNEEASDKRGSARLLVCPPTMRGGTLRPDELRRYLTAESGSSYELAPFQVQQTILLVRRTAPTPAVVVVRIEQFAAPIVEGCEDDQPTPQLVGSQVVALLPLFVPF